MKARIRVSATSRRVTDMTTTADVTELLARHDPMGLTSAGAPADEYEPEAGTIVPRLAEAGSVDDVVDIVHAEFQTWFDGAAGPRDRYVPVATELWEAVQRG